MSQQRPPVATFDITLFAYGRDESSTTLECYTGSLMFPFLEEIKQGTLTYSLSYKAAGEPSFTVIFSYVDNEGGERPFITKEYWLYTHKHGSTASGQYKVEVTSSSPLLTYTSNIVTVPAFYGFGIKTTRASSNGRLKVSKKTRNELPKF
jgi:hypothetical protein